MPVSKFFRVAVEGATCDGRTLERQHIDQMAETYNPELYGARINLEHFIWSPSGDFKAYGDVIELKADDIADGPLSGRRALFAKVDATDDLVALKEKRQKIYHSVEIHPSFADTGKAYLMGLACTDNPASLGTEMMQFCANSAVNPLASRKHDQACFFTESIESTMEFEAVQAPSEPESGKSWFSRVTELMKGSQQKFSQENAEVRSAVEEVAKSQASLIDQVNKLSNEQENSKLKTEVDTLRSDFTELKKKLTEEDARHYSHRPPATGGDGTTKEYQAEC
ncbi:GPO family capsid scaffolding protein [Limnobaculum xujianqingii]|uniref:GPO family capsid scaffolding protein n=1 Tax=Limnobaculum xujianqingii TaxID=2738837 RepID=UPI00112AE9EA|nr:GPO family capsid scaffolding protein [Limnobaculum xujianqingii]